MLVQAVHPHKALAAKPAKAFLVYFVGVLGEGQRGIFQSVPQFYYSWPVKLHALFVLL